tara:strand:+ start:3121 stop:3597 length:477 start_codon:yes stop_codon:yes gene_type:complete
METHQRDEAIRLLLEQQQSISIQLEQLGLGPSQSQKQEKCAPDGGPISNSHRVMQANKLDTMMVKHKETGADMLINATDFDAAIHESSEPKQEAKSRKSRKAKPAPEPVQASSLTKQELLTMTVANLHTQPELINVAPGDIPDKKADLVDLIIERRGQ